MAEFFKPPSIAVQSFHINSWKCLPRIFNETYKLVLQLVMMSLRSGNRFVEMFMVFSMFQYFLNFS